MKNYRIKSIDSGEFIVQYRVLLLFWITYTERKNHSTRSSIRTFCGTNTAKAFIDCCKLEDEQIKSNRKNKTVEYL